jgi:TP53 regulating kinase-like protein
MERLMVKQKILQRGAEAIILLDKEKVIKKRTKKSYRLKELDDKLRKQRTRSEARLLTKASNLISIPKIKKVDDKSKEIIMDFIQGQRISDYLDSFPLKKQKEICKQLGEYIAKIHDSDIIHGDLTTSNMILKGKEIYFIDFGLGFGSHKIEDKAVDLHLLRQALEAKHFKYWQTLFDQVSKGYSKSKNSKIVLERLKQVEKRGRYKGNY